MAARIKGEWIGKDCLEKKIWRKENMEMKRAA
jgi:hypothetical protein